MCIQQGIHFYVNISNFNDIILDEEKREQDVKRSIHALDTFFSEIERFGTRCFSGRLVVEKITGSRIHLYVLGDVSSGYEIVKAVTLFAYKLSQCINRDIGKYRNLKDFSIQVGCDYGSFYDFEFMTDSGYVENTTIGYVANYAAKLQGLTTPSNISISSEIYNALKSSEQRLFVIKMHSSLRKYQQRCFYMARLSELSLLSGVNVDDEINKAKENANKVNLSEIDFSDVRKLLDYKTLSKTKCKKLMGIPVFADVRGFTSQFDKNGSNLQEMKMRTQGVLQAMYDVSTQHNGIHVQFQGDRELSLYHNIPGDFEGGIRQPDRYCYKNAVLGAMRLIDAVKQYQINVGVGADFGKVFATRIGARGSKDNMLLGETVINADFMEDNNADENQIAITQAVYSGLLAEDPYLAGKFTCVNGYYVATIGYKTYLNEITYENQRRNTQNNNYNAAWRRE